MNVAASRQIVSKNRFIRDFNSKTHHPSESSSDGVFRTTKVLKKTDGNKKTAPQPECRFSMKKAVFVQFIL